MVGGVDPVSHDWLLNPFVTFIRTAVLLNTSVTMSSLSIIPHFFCPLSDSPDNAKLTEQDLASVPSTTPRVEWYADQGLRLSSFDHPFFDSDKSAGELSDCGFFFLGPYHTDTFAVHDLVRCHWCGSVFGCWMATDDVVQQHLNRRPDCLFARSKDPDFLPSDSAMRGMFTRWSTTTTWIKLSSLGVSATLTQPVLDRIYHEKMTYPPDFVSLYQLIASTVETTVTDTPAQEGDIKCTSCANQAIVLYQPCSHVVSCLSCSKGREQCEVCEFVIRGRCVTRLA